MHATRFLLQQRQPLIKFVGKRKTPTNIDHTPRAHPVSPTHKLPESFAAYRQNAHSHGRLAPRSSPSPSSSSSSISGSSSSASTFGGLGDKSGKSLGSVAAAKGEFFDRSELPRRFGRTSWSIEEIEAVESGGASMW